MPKDLDQGQHRSGRTGKTARNDLDVDTKAAWSAGRGCAAIRLHDEIVLEEINIGNSLGTNVFWYND